MLPLTIILVRVSGIIELAAQVHAAAAAPYPAVKTCPKNKS
jgi:hypothetical protein